MLSTLYGSEKREYGDYQTPQDFCFSVCKYIKENGISSHPEAILEPTCGVGNFLYAASSVFCGSDAFGIEINKDYAKEARENVPDANVTEGNIFEISTKEICKKSNILIIGNPPWAINSELSINLPEKTNFKKRRGFDAITGSSNFDICEFIILQLIREYAKTDTTICMLCKTAVARNVLVEIERNDICCKRIELLPFNSKKVFDICVPACVMIISLSSETVKQKRIVCEVKNFDSGEQVDTLTVLKGKVVSLNARNDLEGTCQIKWRQGVKHDCASVMELTRLKDGFVNKRSEIVQIEEDLIFPLVKSSHIKAPIIQNFSKSILVTQKKPGQNTSYIKERFPATWQYLIAHEDSFKKRKSSIYQNKDPFSIFGIGEYSFAPYKVAVSGFYKKPLFCLLCADKPVMLDDTSYFMPFDEYNTAYCMMLLLNSEKVQDFLLSIAFLDNKRPFTAKLLSRLDIKKSINAVSLEAMLQTERLLSLEGRLTAEMYDAFFEYINLI